MSDSSSNVPGITPPPLPVEATFSDGSAQARLHDNVREALAALPFHFQSPINIEGLNATDLFSLNTLLGSAIEVQAVDNLNRLRDVWDRDEEWLDYGFVRFPQSFPDVRLVKRTDHSQPALGIEMKGWYLLSKEGEPSFRYRATAAASSPWDLIAVVPWSLSNVLSGKPRIHDVFVRQSRYAAEMRNYYWQHGRKGDATKRDTSITEPQGIQPYPAAGAAISDKPGSDAGSNFGRIARVSGLMDEWLQVSLDTPLAGIAARYWIAFLSAFSESGDDEAVKRRIASILQDHESSLSNEQASEIVSRLVDLIRLMP